jgi:hypothetical protein
MIPWSSVIGGALIGAGASVLWVVNGRIAGVTGVISELLAPRAGEVAWRVLFLAGLMIGGWVARAAGGPVEVAQVVGPAGVLLGGLAVGYGARMANGCTSGHGVCGMPRGSVRSWVATVVYIGAGMATTVAARAMGWLG